MLTQACSSRIWEAEQDDFEFKTSLGYSIGIRVSLHYIEAMSQTNKQIKSQVGTPDRDRSREDCKGLHRFVCAEIQGLKCPHLGKRQESKGHRPCGMIA